MLPIRLGPSEIFSVAYFKGSYSGGTVWTPQQVKECHNVQRCPSVTEYVDARVDINLAQFSGGLLRRLCNEKEDNKRTLSRHL